MTRDLNKIADDFWYHFFFCGGVLLEQFTYIKEGIIVTSHPTSQSTFVPGLIFTFDFRAQTCQVDGI